MTSWDYAVMVSYLAGITVLGSLFMKGQRTARDFSVASRSMHWIPVAFSLLATNFSAITLLGLPGDIVGRDLIMIPRFAVYLVLTPLTVWLFLGFYHRLEVMSVYQYIGRRFDENLRLVSAGIFLLLRICWMASAQYAAGLALTRLLGLELWYCVLIVGMLVTVYSSLGGIKAVIWTDVIQALLMLGAMILTVTICVLRIPGGAEGIWEISDAGGKLRLFDFSLDFTRTTTLGMFFGITFTIMASYGVDQVVVQRYFTLKDYRSIVRSAYAGMLATIPVILLTACIGLSIYSYFLNFPDRLPAGTAPDLWFPSFILTELPAGITGLIIAGLFAATMSSADSGINSLTVVFIEDICRPMRRRLQGGDYTEVMGSNANRLRELRLARWLSCGFGALATVGAMFVGQIGTVIEISIKLNGVIGGVLLGLFLAAVLSIRTNASGALIGAALGTAFIVYVAFRTSLNFFWYSGAGCLATLGFTLAASRFFPASDASRLDGLTLARRNLPCHEPKSSGSW